MRKSGTKISCFDPLVPEELKKLVKIPWVSCIKKSVKYDAIILATPHKIFIKDIKTLLKQKKNNGVLFDVKGALSQKLVDGRL